MSCEKQIKDVILQDLDDSSLDSSDHSTNRSDAPMEFDSKIVDSTEKKNIESKMTS